MQLVLKRYKVGGYRTRSVFLWLPKSHRGDSCLKWYWLERVLLTERKHLSMRGCVYWTTTNIVRDTAK